MAMRESIASQKKKLRLEEDEALAKIMRLRKQQQLLEEREEEMSRRGLQYLDELDAVEERERNEQDAREKAASEAAAQLELAATEDGPSDWMSGEPSGYDPALGQLTDEDWNAIVGGPGGTPQASQDA